MLNGFEPVFLLVQPIIELININITSIFLGPTIRRFKVRRKTKLVLLQSIHLGTQVNPRYVSTKEMPLECAAKLWGQPFWGIT